jgi:hypothetical protein
METPQKVEVYNEGRLRDLNASGGRARWVSEGGSRSKGTTLQRQQGFIVMDPIHGSNTASARNMKEN